MVDWKLRHSNVPNTLIDTLLADHAIFRIEADLRWIDMTEARLDELAKELTS